MVTASPKAPGTRRAAEWLLTVAALSEIGVGLLVALLPAAVMGLLLGAPLDATAAVAARMMGIAAAALGLTWWPDRNRLEPRRHREIAAGFIGYNLGVGLTFLAFSWTAGRPLPLSWLVAAVHLIVGGAFALLLVGSRRAARS